MDGNKYNELNIIYWYIIFCIVYNLHSVEPITAIAYKQQKILLKGN